MSKKKAFKGREAERMIPVLDDWCPNYPNDEILVHIRELEVYPYPKSTKPRYFVRIYAAGKDDTAMYLDKDCGEYQGEAESVFNTWKKYILDRIPTDGITREWFYEHGFMPY